MPALDYWGKLALQCMENTIGKDPGDIGTPIQACRRPQIVEWIMEKVPNYRGKWLASEKNQIYQRQRCKNHSEYGNWTRTSFRWSQW